MEYRIFEIDERTWRIEEYDENNSVYMYLLTGKRGAALIDTGFGMIDIREVVSTLTKLPVFVINTHGHFDHTGGNPLFDEIHIHPADMEGKLAYLLLGPKLEEPSRRTVAVTI